MQRLPPPPPPLLSRAGRHHPYFCIHLLCCSPDDPRVKSEPPSGNQPRSSGKHPLATWPQRQCSHAHAGCCCMNPKQSVFDLLFQAWKRICDTSAHVQILNGLTARTPTAFPSTCPMSVSRLEDADQMSRNAVPCGHEQWRVFPCVANAAFETAHRSSHLQGRALPTTKPATRWWAWEAAPQVQLAALAP